MSVNVFQGGGIVFCQATTAPDELFCREYLLEDPVLTDAMLGYLDLCRAGERVRSKNIPSTLLIIVCGCCKMVLCITRL